MRNVLVAIGTFTLTAMVIGNAYVQKKQFYPSVVYITKSNPSMAVSILKPRSAHWLRGVLVF